MGSVENFVAVRTIHVASKYFTSRALVDSDQELRTNQFKSELTN